MGQKAVRLYGARLGALRGRIQKWRKTREKCSHMPKPLWDSAVELARVGGVDSVAQQLGINHEATRGRKKETQGTRKQNRSKKEVLG